MAKALEAVETLVRPPDNVYYRELTGRYRLTERTARAADLNTSLCAVLLAEACNTGLEPLVHNDFPALRRDRLSWVNQNYIREETLLAANAKLVSAQSQIALAHVWGGGEVASADGIRFVVPWRRCMPDPIPSISVSAVA